MKNQAMAFPDFDLSSFPSVSKEEKDETLLLLAESTDDAIERDTVELKKIEPLALAYSNVQHVQLTRLQHKLLTALSDSKIADAPMRDIVSAFKVLKDKELVANGKPTEIHGLVGYLEILEREEVSSLKEQQRDITPIYNYTDEEEAGQLSLFEVN